MAPLMKSVEKAGLRGVRLKRNPADIRPEDFFILTTRLRTEFAKLINVADADRIAIVPSASYGLATVVKNLPIERGQQILVAGEQFPSNYYPWQALAMDKGAEVTVVSPDKGAAGRGKNWNEKLLESINTKTKAVAIGHVHWTDGTLFDLEAIRRRTRAVGAWLIIDGTQSVGALPFDIQTIQPDALVCAAYKWLLGPYSIGLAYYGEQFSDGKPIEENWINRLGSENFSGLVNYEDRYQSGMLRYSVGEQSNFILVPMALNAISQINRWGVTNIQRYCESITTPAVNTLREKGFLIEEPGYRSSHLFGIRHAHKWDPQDLKERLSKNKIHVSVRGDAIRVSPHVYNDAGDLQRLVKVLTASIR